MFNFKSLFEKGGGEEGRRGGQGEARGEEGEVRAGEERGVRGMGG